MPLPRPLNRLRARWPRLGHRTVRAVPWGDGRLWLLLVAVLVLAVPAAASDRFADVPAGAVHHDAADRLARAGVTQGCSTSPPRFCSDERVTRRQMALFLDRLAPRSASASNAASLSPADGGGLGGTPAAVTIRTAGSSGGTGAVTLQGSVTVRGEASGCPCAVEAFVYRPDGDGQGPSTLDQLPAQAAGGEATVSLPVTWAPSAPAGEERRYAVGVFVEGASGPVTAEATLTATAVAYRQP